MTDLQRTLAEIAAAPLPPIKRPDPPYRDWYETDLEGLTYRIPYWYQNANTREEPDIELGPHRDWQLLGVGADLVKVLQREIAEAIMAEAAELADDPGARADWEYERRRDREFE